MKRPDGLTFIAVLHFLNSAALALGTLAIVAIPVTATWLTASDTTGRYWALYGLGLAAALTGGLSLLAFLAGWGLIRLIEWARWLTVMLALLAVPFFPVGSLIAVGVIAYLLQPALSEVFQPRAQARSFAPNR